MAHLKINRQKQFFLHVQQHIVLEHVRHGSNNIQVRIRQAKFNR